MIEFKFSIYVLLFYFITPFSCDDRPKEAEPPKGFTLLTVATDETDGFRRLKESADYYNVPLKVLGKSTEWQGGDMASPGGGQKINFLKRELKKLREEPDFIVMFTDGYDVILNEDANAIIEKFKSFEAKIVFSAEMFCWPVRALGDSYPVTASSYKYLNSGGYIGYAKDLYDLIKDAPIKDDDDDQLYFTKLFLDKPIREKYNMKLDTRALIFQNLYGAEGDVKLEQNKGGESYLKNLKFDTMPSVIHGNGLAKLTLNSYGNYLAGAWHPVKGSRLDHNKLPEMDPLPFVYMAIFVTQKTPFIIEFFNKISKIDYPEEKIHLFIYNNVEFHRKDVQNFLENAKTIYASVKEVKPTEGLEEFKARDLALDQCLVKRCSYLFSVDNIAHLDNPRVLQNLMESNVSVVAPLLVRPYKVWSNFWGDINSDGFYARSFDYMDIANNEIRGIWNVPFIASCYLINASIIPTIRSSYSSDLLTDTDMAFCKALRDKGVFMYVKNVVDLGHLINPESFRGDEVTNPDFYELLNNRWDWERKYIHPDYPENFKPDKKLQQPCPDVYWFPMVTKRFCKELIEIMENFGKWSSGSNQDERLNGGYENVPTRDIHMNQVGLEPLWLEFLQVYVRPLQELVFVGYFHDPPKSLMNFVVRYRPDEQPFLRPHHDSSTYTINLALNRPNLDYQGGGCRFIRYNCSVTDTRLGWMLMHPGRLTHFHEGLKVTGGTRYIMISFVDP